jgi:hypothetical protein
MKNVSAVVLMLALVGCTVLAGMFSSRAPAAPTQDDRRLREQVKALQDVAAELRDMRRCWPASGSFCFSLPKRWQLDIAIEPDGVVRWTYRNFETDRRDRDADTRWEHGRRCAAGRDYVHFRAVLKLVGLTVGQVEAELRSATGYAEA